MATKRAAPAANTPDPVGDSAAAAEQAKADKAGQKAQAKAARDSEKAAKAQERQLAREANAAERDRVKTEKAAARQAAKDAGEVKSRRNMGGRNWLAREIDRVIREANGPITVKDICAAIKNNAGGHPSSGAVAAALLRWKDAGYVNTTEKPLGFKAMPAAHSKSTFDAFLDKSRERRAKDRAAAKETASA